jgi:hypothetical protein
VCRPARRIGLDRQLDHTLGHFTRQRRNARGTRLVAQQTFDAFLHEPLQPAPHDGLGLGRPAHDLVRAETLRRQQHDPRSPNVLLRAVPIRRDRFKPKAIGGAYIDCYPCAHPADSHANKPAGIRCHTEWG